MKIATARSFYEKYIKQVQAITPNASWALFELDGSWFSSPKDREPCCPDRRCLLCPQFKETLLKIPALKWVHSENSGIDGRFYRSIRKKGII